MNPRPTTYTFFVEASRAMARHRATVAEALRCDDFWRNGLFYRLMVQKYREHRRRYLALLCGEAA